MVQRIRLEEGKIMSNPNITQVSCKYGAPMGRTSDNPANFAGIKVHLAKVPLKGDYDAGGAYWGSGMPLWCAWSDEAVMYIRAPTRQQAKATLPNARFFR